VIHPQDHCQTLQDGLCGAEQVNQRQELLLPEQKMIDLEWLQ
jgi:hypothetical protein